MDEGRLRELFRDRHRLAARAAPSLGSVLQRSAPRRRAGPLLLAVATAAGAIAVVTLWPRPHPPEVSAAALMAWRAPTDPLLDFDPSSGLVLEEEDVAR